MKLVAAYMGVLAFLAMWGGVDAVAQAVTVPSSTVVPPSPVGPVMFDLGNLTLPGACVVIAYLFREGFPLKITVRHQDDRTD